ncbi:WXG100 family type VII secretion target [Aporhodopirellula aestuarii]|uniref:WXG100 family type VII secretion target n=1 Tax=Aporhodopirellula aestuarii TaxID=2950107 RepID=A0ABT0UAM3_9BACT|nr:WXG100 family type VII secretion target [Aporhodopirellula aestuarii]MCM2373433.1 WXG100 family type VII secretion target [Aporhodopirellula aestuarii]
MNQAIGDPDQIRQFAAQLAQFTEELRQRGGSLAAQMNQLEQSWRDEQQRKFNQEFQDQLRQLQRLIQATDQHVPYLMRKAEQLDQYLGR